MTVEDAWNHYYTHTGTASRNVRKLGFTGIALVWIFSGGGISNVELVTIKGRYLWPLTLLVLALVADFLQYVYLASAWRIFVRQKEKELTDLSEEFRAPDKINLVGEIFFAVKILLIATGFVWLLISLSEKVLP